MQAHPSPLEVANPIAPVKIEQHSQLGCMKDFINSTEKEDESHTCLSNNLPQEEQRDDHNQDLRANNEVDISDICVMSFHNCR